MIRISVIEPDDTTWRRWRRECDSEARKLPRRFEPDTKITITDLYKRKAVKKRFYLNVDGPFAGKCAYCETYLRDFQNGDLDHYRPKAGVTDEQDRPVIVTIEGRSFPHPGYYWLAYDWQNLLPSCVSCNRPTVVEGEKLGKHNRFPVRGSYAENEDEIGDEEPLLIHPVQEDPDDHLECDGETGTMIPTSDRGEMTVRIFGLNRRGRLIEERRKAALHTKALLMRVIMEPSSRKETLGELKRILEGKTAYTAACRAIYREVLPLIQGIL